MLGLTPFSSSSYALIWQSSPAAVALQGLDSMRMWNRVHNFICSFGGERRNAGLPVKGILAL